MTSLPEPGPRKLGLVIDLDTCVGCHACAVACKSWNTGGQGGPLADTDAYGEEPEGIWFNRVHTFETEERTVHFPRSCLHCENAACVTVCPTGASYKRAEDGIVLVDPELVHRLQALLLGLPVRGARAGPGARGDEEMHAVRGPDLQ